jgi:hypothetical protein
MAYPTDDTVEAVPSFLRYDAGGHSSDCSSDDVLQAFPQAKDFPHALLAAWDPSTSVGQQHRVAPAVGPPNRRKEPS